MTPEQFAERMKWIMRTYPVGGTRDKVVIDLMSDALSDLGYSKGIDIYEKSKEQEIELLKQKTIELQWQMTMNDIMNKLLSGHNEGVV